MKKVLQSYISSYKGLSKESWALSLVMLINRTGGMVLPFLTVYLTSELKFTTTEAGLVMSFFGIGGMFGSLLGGWLTDKIGFFKVQFMTLFLAAPFYIILIDLTQVYQFCIAMLLLSTIYESFRPANSAAITFYANKNNITRAFSLNRMAVNLGFSLGPAIGGFLATFSFAYLFYGNSFALFLTAIVFFLYFYRKQKALLNRNEEDVFVGNQNSISPFKDKDFIIFSIFTFLYACVFFQLLSILPLFYKNHLGFSKYNLGLILGFNGLIVVVFEMLLVSFAEKIWSAIYTIIFGCILLLLSFLWLLVDDSVFSCYLSMAFLSISEILVLPFMSTVTANRSNEKNRGAYMGMNGLSIGSAFIVMPISSTFIAENYSFEHLWIINILILAICIFGFHWIRKKLE